MKRSLFVVFSLIVYSYFSYASEFLIDNLEPTDLKILTNRKSTDSYPYQPLYSQIVPPCPQLSAQIISKIAQHLSPLDVHHLEQVNKHFQKSIAAHHRLLNRQYLQRHYCDGHNDEALHQNFKRHLTTCAERAQNSPLFSYQPFKSWLGEFFEVRLRALLAPHCTIGKQLQLYFDYIDFIKNKKFLYLDKTVTRNVDHDLSNGTAVTQWDHTEQWRDQLKLLSHDKTVQMFVEAEKNFYQATLDKALRIIAALPRDHSLINPYWKFQLLCFQGKRQEAINYISTINKSLDCDPEILYLTFKQSSKNMIQSATALLQLAHIDYRQWKKEVVTRLLNVNMTNVEAWRTYINNYIDLSRHKIAKAQYSLGQLHHRGHYQQFYAPQNLITALEWYMKAADNGHAQAQSTLYSIYLHRDKVLLAPKKTHLINVEYHSIKILKAKVLTWLQEAAAQGIASAQYHYGMQNFISQHYNVAKSWFKLAAAQEFTTVFSKLGQIYELEHKGPLYQNPQALYWYDQAALQGHKDAQFKMRLAYNLKMVEQTETPQDVAFVSNAQYELGVLYAHGDKLLEPDPHLAYSYLCSSANLGNAMALYELGTWYEKGYYVDEDIHQAASLYQESADLGFSGALCKRAKTYQRFQDNAKASELYKKLEYHHDPRYQYYYGKAIYELNKLSHDNRLSHKDDFEATFYLYKAATFGYPKAQYDLIVNSNKATQSSEYAQYSGYMFRKLYAAAVNRNRKARFYLGQLYAQGLGVKQNFNRAAKWYSKSSQQGYDKAQIQLQVLYDEGLILKPLEEPLN